MGFSGRHVVFIADFQDLVRRSVTALMRRVRDGISFHVAVLAGNGRFSAGAVKPVDAPSLEAGDQI
jgi:hypothetical protein